MKLVRVEFEKSAACDPARERVTLDSAKTVFDAEDGYEMHLRDGVVSIRHDGTKLVALIPFTRCSYALAEPEPSEAKGEAVPDVKQQESNMKQQGKRR